VWSRKWEIISWVGKLGLGEMASGPGGGGVVWKRRAWAFGRWKTEVFRGGFLSGLFVGAGLGRFRFVGGGEVEIAMFW
jgi:hypothetical protein